MNIKIRFLANIQIYSNFWEFTNKYLNIFGCPKIYEWISEYIRTGEMARIRIQIIFKGHFIWIFEYSNIWAHHCLTPVTWHLSPVTCHLSPVTLPPLYAASSSMKVPGGLVMPLREIWWLIKKKEEKKCNKKPKLKENQLLFWHLRKNLFDYKHPPLSNKMVHWRGRRQTTDKHHNL